MNDITISKLIFTELEQDSFPVSSVKEYIANLYDVTSEELLKELTFKLCEGLILNGLVNYSHKTLFSSAPTVPNFLVNDIKKDIYEKNTGELDDGYFHIYPTILTPTGIILSDEEQKYIEWEKYIKDVDSSVPLNPKEPLEKFDKELVNITNKINYSYPFYKTLRLNAEGASKVFINSSGQLHCVGGPAVVWPDGSEEYWVEGKLHRQNGPAVITTEGLKQFWVSGKLSRLPGPAVVWPDGSEEYWVEGKLHRQNGPAVITTEGLKQFWVNGRRIQ